MLYLTLLEKLHAALQPQAYLEIGVEWGHSLKLSQTRTVGIDPKMWVGPEALVGKPWIKLFRTTSDAFFREHTANATLEGAPLDLAFIDGLHEFAQVVRDLEHIEQWGHPGTVVAIHDVIPRNVSEASRSFQPVGWTGDVWRVVPFLREHRPDLLCWLTAAHATGLLLITRLNPTHSGMARLADSLDRSYPPDGPEYEQLVAAWLSQGSSVPPEVALQAVTGPSPSFVDRLT